MIAAEGEQKASRALREAAETIADSHSALQVGTRGVSRPYMIYKKTGFPYLSYEKVSQRWFVGPY